ncbi:MAG: hypothetical protein ACF8R7_05705 [Phycisphaerales bacterium JB039]
MAPVPTPDPPQHFEYRQAADAAGISQRDLHAIIRLFELDYPEDLMLRELHILRTCRAVQEGRVRLADLLKQAPPSSAA